MKTEEYTDRESFLAALHGKATKRTRQGGATLPRPATHRSTGNGLGDWTLSAAERLAGRGFQIAYDARQFVSAWHTDGRRTAWYRTLGEAVEAIERKAENGVRNEC